MKRLIHKGFFREMVRQLRTKGLVSVFILAGINLITFASFVTRDPLRDSFTHVSASEMAAPMLFFLYIMLPIMVFGAYRWMNKRAQSDFYHAIPLTRTQLYGSTSAAILLWIVIALVSFAGFRAILYAAFDLPFNYLLYLCVFLNMLIAAVEILAAFSIGSALTGTKFVAFFSGLVVLFLPRAALSAFWIMVEIDSAFAVPFSALPFFMNPAFNIAATPIHSIVYRADFANVPAMLYSLLYACALLVLGGLAFHKRRSEAAEIPYASRLLQTTVGVCFGLLPLAGLTVLLNVRYRYGYSSYSVPYELLTPLAVTSVLFSFAFFCLYELISSRKMKAVARAMKFYPACLVIAAFLLFVPAWIGTRRAQPKVTAGEIRSYRINNESTLTVPYGRNGDDSYAKLVLSQHSFTDETGKRLIEDFSKTESLDRDFLSLTAGSVTVNAGGLFRKVIHVPDKWYGEDVSNLWRLYEACLSDPSLIEELYAFPGGCVWYECSGLLPEEANEVGRIFAEEYNALSLSQRKALQKGGIPGMFKESDRISTRATGLSIKLYSCKGTTNYEATYLINDLTPKAAEKYLSILNARNGERSRKALKAFVKWMETGRESDTPDALWIGSFSIDDWTAWHYDDRELFDTPKDASPKLYRILKVLSDAPLSADVNNCITVSARDYHIRYYDFIFPAGFEIPKDCREDVLRWIREGEWWDEDRVPAATEDDWDVDPDVP
ncbi:MAG: hypothetical protein II117_08525 [Clostridia bacterium]|nr:hypothetical protein [Clostridia bacterium]